MRRMVRWERGKQNPKNRRNHFAADLKPIAGT